MSIIPVPRGITIRKYGGYKGGNYGAHAIEVTVRGVRIFFSYTTPIAFYARCGTFVSRVNEWGPTTGRHLREAEPGDARQRRCPGDLFMKRLNLALEGRWPGKPRTYTPRKKRVDQVRRFDRILIQDPV